VIVAASQTPAGATDLTSSTRIICEFDGTTGSATVPAAAMAALSPSFTGTTAFNVGGGVTQDKVLGSQPLHVYAINALTQVVTVK
jgi:PAB1-binding protein PBP1